MVEEAQLKQGECYNPKKAIFDRATEEVNKQLKRQMILYKRRIKELELQIELLEEENQKLKESKQVILHKVREQTFGQEDIQEPAFLLN